MKKLRLLVIISVIFSLLIVNTSEVFCIEKKIHKNVYINEINVSSLTKEQCKKLINSYVDKNRYIVLEYEKNDVIIDKREIGVSYNVDKAVDMAYDTGRNSDIISNLKKVVSLSRGKKEVILLEALYDISKINEAIDLFNRDIYKAPVDAAIKISNGKLDVSEDSKGITIDKDSLRGIILDNIKNCSSCEVKLPIKILQPKYTRDRLKDINTLLGSYETKFNPKNQNRVNNIAVAAESTSNLIIDTEEEFSFNDILINQRNRLMEAPIIINGKSEKGLGGGICQVSTTIYNAALYAGMDIVAICNHSIPSLYIEKGRDATVSQGSIDFKFKNTNDTPIFIYNQVIGDTIKTEIYGNIDDKREVDIETQIVKVINNNTVYKLDSNLPKGTTEIEQKGRTGYKINTFRIYKNNGKIIKKEFINTSYYPPCDEIILVGSNKNYVTE